MYNFNSSIFIIFWDLYAFSVLSVQAKGDFIQFTVNVKISK